MTVALVCTLSSTIYYIVPEAKYQTLIWLQKLLQFFSHFPFGSTFKANY